MEISRQHRAINLIADIRCQHGKNGKEAREETEGKSGIIRITGEGKINKRSVPDKIRREPPVF